MFYCLRMRTTQVHVGSKHPSSVLSSQGFTHIENIFTDEELQPSIDALRRTVDEIAQKLYKAGKIKSRFMTKN